MNWLLNVTINDISVIYVTAHTCAGGLKKKLDMRADSQRHRHFVGFFNVLIQAPTRDRLWFRPVFASCLEFGVPKGGVGRTAYKYIFLTHYLRLPRLF